MFNKPVIFLVNLSNTNETIATILVIVIIVVAILLLLLAILCCFIYRTDEDAGDQEWQQTKKGDG